MNTLHSILSATILLWAAIPPTKAAVSVSVDFFHENLEPYGEWREVGDYGYCWQPRDVDRDWRPYSDGRWLYTDAGWTWDSEEPYSWAVYHYGRWARVDRVGWIWIPGTEWGPAWVSWRRSPRHVGWAPLPPEAVFTRSIGFGGRVDADYDIGPTNYSFVEVRNFGAPRLRRVIVEPRENITIINQTTNITRITYVNNVVVNEGPQYDAISRESAQPIRRLKLDRHDRFDGDPRSAGAGHFKPKVEGDSLRVVAPAFDANPASVPRKIAAKVEKVEVDRGWKDAGPPAEVAKLRTKIKAEPVAAVEPPSQPKSDKPAEAPVLTPAPPPAPDEKPAKGKVRNRGQTPSPAVPIKKEVAPAAPENPVAPGKEAKPGKQPKGPSPVKPEADRPPASPPAAKMPDHPQAKKGKKNVVEPPRVPAATPPQARVPARKPETQSVEPKRKVPAAAVEAPRPKVRAAKEPARPKPEQPAVRTVERKAPAKPEPRPQARKPEPRPKEAPVVKQPQPPAPAPVKGKGKGKDEKKDAVNGQQ